MPCPQQNPGSIGSAAGRDDGMMVSSRKLKAFCDERGYQATLYESEGGHIWRNWRVYLTIFAQHLFR